MYLNVSIYIFVHAYKFTHKCVFVCIQKKLAACLKGPSCLVEAASKYSSKWVGKPVWCEGTRLGLLRLLCPQEAKTISTFFHSWVLKCWLVLPSTGCGKTFLKIRSTLWGMWPTFLPAYPVQYAFRVSQALEIGQHKARSKTDQFVGIWGIQ